MFRYRVFYGWLMAGTVKKRSLSPSPCLVFFSCGKQKEARTLPLLRDGCSNFCCETRMQEGAERNANVSRMENANGSAPHCRLGQIQSCERANAIASSSAELYLLVPNKLGLGRSLSLSLARSFVVIRKTFQERDASVCDIFPFLYFQGIMFCNLV